MSNKLPLPPADLMDELGRVARRAAAAVYKKPDPQGTILDKALSGYASEIRDQFSPASKRRKGTP